MEETDSDAVIVSEIASSELSNDLNEFVIDDTTEGDEGEDFVEDVSETNNIEGEDFPSNIEEEGENFDSSLWHDELDNALNGDYVDHGIVKSICKCRVVPNQYRMQVWKLCLNINNRNNSMLSWDKKLDLQEQEVINTDCKQLIEGLIESGCDLNKEQSLEDVIAVVTFYCKSRAIKYKSDYECMSVLRVLVQMELDCTSLYNCFYAIQSRFIPRTDLSASVTEAPYNLLRLLLLYHDPELCNFLDTCRITPEHFTKTWFSSLFTAVCSHDVCCALWDIYFQRSDPFFIFFLSLVILVNAKEQIVTSGELPDRDETVKILKAAPSVLSSGDVDDFCQLASYYSDRTPSSFKRDLAACFYNRAMISSSSKLNEVASELKNSFCLNISIPELLLSSQPQDDLEEEETQIRYFLVDCRPADQYNEEHLLTAFHLDATLMLSEPDEFDEALTSLFAAQEQAIKSGSSAGGQHLCFIGSGSTIEDQYMFMVIANLLQKRRNYISVASGGYKSLLEYFNDVKDIDISDWIVGSRTSEEKKNLEKGDKKSNFMKKLSVGWKSLNLKEKVSKLIENTEEEWNQAGRPSTSKQVTSSDADPFSIGGEESSSDGNEADDESHNVANLSSWKRRSDTRHCFECQFVRGDGQLKHAHLHIGPERMTCLLEVDPRTKKGNPPKVIRVRSMEGRSLRAIVRITSKKSFPELITFRFGDPEQMKDMTEFEGTGRKIEVVASDKYIIPDAGTCTTAIKRLIQECDEKFRREQKAGSS